MNTKRFVVAFSGTPGSSKTPISHYLSTKFNLPIFSTDAVRMEITENFLTYDRDEYKKLRDIRLKAIIENGNSFILDASVDREWEKYKEMFYKAGFNVFLINMDLSKGFLLKLYKAKIYYQTIPVIDKWMKDHKNFLKEYSGFINLTITDKNFKDRFRIISKALNRWVKIL